MGASYPALKRARLARLADDPGFIFVEGALEEPGRLTGLFADHRPGHVIHLAAQAGVRHSLDVPRDYITANLIGTFELLEAARLHPPDHLLLASTSSVYGAEPDRPYAETQKADTQMSVYAATKKGTEALAHSYAHLYRLPVTMFRFFTVYGPWGRPDMAYFGFTKAILEGTPIRVFNQGRMSRDFTYIDDLAAAILALSRAVPGATPVGEIDSLSPVAPFRVVNIGADAPVQLLEFIAAIEAACGREAQKIFEGMQPGDVPATWADTRLLTALTGQRPNTALGDGITAFVDWYRAYYGI